MSKRRKRLTQSEQPPSGTELTGLALLLSEMPVETLDLHGMTADAAEGRVLLFFERHALTSPGKVVHVITGKGAHSSGEPVLPGLVREILMYDLTRIVVEYGGLPGGGGYAARLAGPSGN